VNLLLKGKTALISGSSRGIGRAIAEDLLAEGASVILTARGAGELQRAQRSLAKASAPERVHSFAGDLTDPPTIKRLQATLAKQKRLPNIVVANIGSGKSVSGWKAPDEEWERVFRINLFGAIDLVQSMLPHLVRNRWGRVIVIASIAGIESTPAPTPYAAAKAALVMAAQSLSRLTGASGVTVNVVAPGNILFPGSTWDRKLKADRAAVERLLRAEVPAGRLGTPAEVAAAVTFLASERAAFINGACLVVDGGQTRSFG
jgi:3-oxoacyl-[acyl-carrier protein] reductase